MTPCQSIGVFLTNLTQNRAKHGFSFSGSIWEILDKTTVCIVFGTQGILGTEIDFGLVVKLLTKIFVFNKGNFRQSIIYRSVGQIKWSSVAFCKIDWSLIVIGFFGIKINFLVFASPRCHGRNFYRTKHWLFTKVSWNSVWCFR